MKTSEIEKGKPQMMAVKTLSAESSSFTFVLKSLRQSFLPGLLYSTVRFLLGAVHFELGERKCFSLLLWSFLSSPIVLKSFRWGFLLALLWVSLAMRIASQGPFEFFGKQKQKQSLYPGFIGKPCFSWLGLPEGMSSKATWTLASLKAWPSPVLTESITF